MRNIGVIGAGHVGLVTAACLAKLGHRVTCADNDTEKIENLKKLVMPFYEPGLEELVKEAVSHQLLSFISSLAKLAEESEIIFIAVGTPPTSEGRADLSFVEQVTVELANSLSAMKGRKENAPKNIYRLIVEKSTVPVLTGEWVKRTLELLSPTGLEFDVAANPEFLREGCAIKDFMEPDRIVVGVESERARKIFEEIYSGIKGPILFTDIKSAELIKHASNCFLALKISYANALAQVCERVGADIEKVLEGMGLDKRIGLSFLRAGVGYGGSCLPKDVAAFISLCEEIGYPFALLREVEKINQGQRRLVVKKVRELLWNLKGKQIAIWGLAFKPDTDDVRDSPAIEIINSLTREGAVIKAHDPMAVENMKKVIPNISYCSDPYEAARDAHLVVLLTDWNIYRQLDFEKIKQSMKIPRLIDGRNFLDPEKLRGYGFIYRGIGRK
ncbi:MAG: UDP-glucose/GDP-mannose dehydrogenase family protein [Candidatus Omnitrophica bacterium]|nr:UDP-glucose/GDP-mannose dehydrogenase family protein [Candidatus Omnitrophota bacterium]